MTRFDKPRGVALGLSIVFSAFLFAVLFSLNMGFNSVFSPTLIIGLSIAFALLSYVVLHYAINTFIYQKIRLIYKNIYEFKGASSPNVRRQNPNLEAVGAQVAQWANERRTEIEMLRAREDFRREFIGNISHELKTPIFNIQGYMLTLLDGALDDKEINRKYLKRANKSVDRMIAIIDDLEVIADLEGNRVKLNYKRYDLAEQVQEVFDLLEDKARKRNISLSLEPFAEKVVRVQADKGKIEQVLINLVGNALKYGKTNGRVTVKFYDMDDRYLIEVEDDGLGIPEQDLPRVFERFYRVDKSRSRDAGGTGLGLSIVKHIMEAHNQTIKVSSKEGEGSLFSLTLKKAK
jgi:two-component system phosphate regulon sensor histidine kinase PhoR